MGDHLQASILHWYVTSQLIILSWMGVQGGHNFEGKHSKDFEGLSTTCTFSVPTPATFYHIRECL